MISPEFFHKDGIIDEPLWNKAKPRICFLMKEPNNPEGKAFDFREWWRDEPIKGGFSARVAEWSRGMIEDFPPYDELWRTNDERDIREIRKSIALVNVKKTGGEGLSEYKPFMLEAFGANSEEQGTSTARVLDQIDIIDPQVIILGLSWESLRQLLFPDVEWKPTGCGIDVGTWKRRRLIDFYHPSAKNAPPASYALLEKVWRSDVFKSL